jgi:hypothetical protein
MVIALRGHPLEANFQRILAWCVASSAFAIAGGLAHGNARGPAVARFGPPSRPATACPGWRSAVRLS